MEGKNGHGKLLCVSGTLVDVFYVICWCANDEGLETQNCPAAMYARMQAPDSIAWLCARF